MIKLFVLTVFLLVGGMTEMMASVIYRDVKLAPGQTFYINLPSPFNGTQDVYLCVRNIGATNCRSWYRLGKVSAYAKCCVTVEDEGEYWFGYYDDNNVISWKLCVTLTITGSPRLAFVVDSDTRDKLCKDFNHLLMCLLEERYVLKQRMNV